MSLVDRSFEEVCSIMDRTGEVCELLVEHATDFRMCDLLEDGGPGGPGGGGGGGFGGMAGAGGPRKSGDGAGLGLVAGELKFPHLHVLSVRVWLWCPQIASPFVACGKRNEQTKIGTLKFSAEQHASLRLRKKKGAPAGNV
jgi:hypothetical protein